MTMTITKAAALLAKLQTVESFIEGFSDDLGQDGISAMLETVRAAMATLSAIHDDMTRGARLFNCQPGNREPAWGKYTKLELAAVRDEFKDKPGDETHMMTCGQKRASLWSVYGRDREGMADCITDITDRETVLDVVSELMARSGLPCAFAHNFGGE